MTDASDYDLFARIAELGSISAAAARLGISAPMASKRLARLEARLGARLINRSTRRIVLTGAGQTFRDDAVAILNAIQAAEARLAGTTQTLSGPLRVSAPTSFGRMHVAPYLKPFLEAHPQIEFTLDLSDRFVDVLGDGVDLALRISRGMPASLTSWVLAPNRRILCASPAYLDRNGRPATLRDLHQHMLLAAQGQSPWRLAGPEGAVTFDVKSAVQTNSSEVVRELALTGLGIALRSLWDVNADLAAGRLVRVLDNHEGLTDVHIQAVHLRHATQPRRVTAFIDYLRGLYQPIAPWER